MAEHYLTNPMHEYGINTGMFKQSDYMLKLIFLFEHV